MQRFRKEATNHILSTHLHLFHLQQLAELLNLAGDVADADGAARDGAVDVPASPTG